MPKLAIIATIEVAPGRRDQLLPLLMAHRSRCSKDEAGITLQFEVLLPHDVSYEVYRDAAALAQFRKETAGMGVNVSVTRCAIVDSTQVIFTGDWSMPVKEAEATNSLIDQGVSASCEPQQLDTSSGWSMVQGFARLATTSQ